MGIATAPKSKKRKKRNKIDAILIEWKLSNITWYKNPCTFQKVLESRWVSVPIIPLRDIFYDFEKLFLTSEAMNKKNPLRLKKRVKGIILKESFTERRRPIAIFVEKAMVREIQEAFDNQPSFSYVLYPLESDLFPDRTYVDSEEESETAIKFYLRPLVF